MINDLPIECKSNVLRFLCIYDVLTYASTSKISMYNVLPLIYKIRKDMMKSILQNNDQDKVVIINGQHNFYRRCDVVGRNVNVNVNERHSSHLADKKLIKNNTILPSILERLQSLYRIIPLAHRLNWHIHELILSIEKTHELNSLDSFQKDMKDIQFDDLFETFQNMLKVHKLHANLLQSTIYFDPLLPSRNTNIIDNQTTRRPNWYSLYDDNNAMDIHLDQYLGDVLIAHICMGNTVSGLVEGTSETKWLDHCLNQVSKKNIDTICVSTLYQSWIFLHSTMLRNSLLSREEMDRFSISEKGILLSSSLRRESSTSTEEEGIVSTSLTSSFTDHLIDNMIKPPIAFHGNLTKTIHEMCEKTRFESSLTISFRDFGPLGPAFRGRDSLTLHSIYMENILESLLCRTRAKGSNNISETIMKLGLIHSESKKRRPMSCAPHTISLQSSYSTSR
mmetsp:Transcript_6737/g.7615  ORF Transcript_6737/g.7615 Transcript_6737/m.7615 type:complete len:450 (-) Transcript_6737:796-2145(-)